MPDGFNLHIETDVFLTVDEIWPDHDGPENPTKDDVVELIHRLYGAYSWGARDLLTEWNLDLGMDVDGTEVWV